MPHILYLSDEIVDALRGSGAKAWLDGVSIVRNAAGDVFLQMNEGATFNYVPGKTGPSNGSDLASHAAGRPRPGGNADARDGLPSTAGSGEGGVDNLEAGSVALAEPVAAGCDGPGPTTPGEASAEAVRLEDADPSSLRVGTSPDVITVPIVKDPPRPPTLVFTAEKEAGKCCHYCMNVSYSAGN